MMRKITLLFLLCIGICNASKAQVLDSVSIFIAPHTDTSCPGTQLVFTAVQSNDTFTSTSYNWYTDGIFTGVTIDTFYTTALNNGDYVYCIINYTDNLGNAQSYTSNTITVYHSTSIPPQVFIALTTGSNPDCGGHPLTFTAYPDNGGSAPQYQWLLNDTAVAGATSTTFTGIFPGGDSVSCMMISNSTCAPYDTAYSAAIPIIHYNLTAGVSITATRNAICNGGLDTFTATATDEGSGSSIAWYVDTSSIPSALGNVYITDSLANGDLVYCVLTAPDSCILNHTAISNVITVTVVPNANTSASIAITRGGNPDCLDSPLTFTATYANFGSVNTVWLVNGIGAASNTPTFTDTPASGTLVGFEIMSTDGGCYTHDTIIVPNFLLIRDSTPTTPLISLIGNLLVATNAGSPGNTFTWYGPFGIVPGITTSSFHPASTGYYYCIQDSALCHSDTSNTIYISLLSVNNVNTANIKVYPNPNTGTLYTDFGSNTGAMKLDIYNLLGQGMLHEDIDNQPHHQTNISYLPDGSYFVVLRAQDGTTSTFKILLAK